MIIRMRVVTGVQEVERTYRTALWLERYQVAIGSEKYEGKGKHLEPVMGDVDYDFTGLQLRDLVSGVYMPVTRIEKSEGCFYRVFCIGRDGKEISKEWSSGALLLALERHKEGLVNWW